MEKNLVCITCGGTNDLEDEFCVQCGAQIKSDKQINNSNLLH